MNYHDQEALDAAQSFAHHGNDVVSKAYAFIKKHKRTVEISTLSTAIAVVLRHQPKNAEEFLKRFVESARFSFPCSIAANEIYDYFD